MNKLNGIIKSFLIGVGFGSFFLLSIQLIFSPTVEISRNEFLIVTLSSGIIGQYSHLFHSEKISFLTAEICHFILTLTTVLVVARLLYNATTWTTYFILFVVFVIVYLLVWLVILLFTNHEIKEVNKKI